MQRIDFDFAPVSKRIKEARMDKRATQEEVASACGCGFKHLGAVERNDSNPSVALLVRLSNYYNKTVDYFLKDSPDISDAYLDQEIAELLKKLNKNNKQHAINVLHEILLMQDEAEMKSD